MVARELNFRKDLMDRMASYWKAMVNVESHLNPGVPDLAYVMNGSVHETGWLELKAPAKLVDTKIERSQYVWMDNWGGRVPSHILINAGEWCYILDGRLCRKFENVSNMATADFLSIFKANKLESELPQLLSELTKRNRKKWQTSI